MPDPARVSDPTTDGGTIARGCDHVLSGGLPVARENDLVVTPKLGAGSIAQHASTVEVGGRLMAITGNLCQKGGPGDAGLGIPDILSMSRLELLKAQLEEARRRQDAGEELPRHEMRASPERPPANDGPGREYTTTNTTDANGAETSRSSYGVEETQLGSANVGGNQFDLVRTREAGIVERTLGDSPFADQFTANSTAFSENYVLTITQPGGARTELSGGYDLLFGGTDNSASIFNAETQEYGPQLDLGAGGGLGAVAGQARTELSAIDALSNLADPTGVFGVGDRLRDLAPGLDEWTLEASGAVGAGVEAAVGVNAKAVYDAKQERVELGLGGLLAIAGIDLQLSLGRRRTDADAIGGGGGEDVAVAPAPGTVVVEGR